MKGRVYLEQGRFNTENDGKRKLLYDDCYLIDNPNFRFGEYEKIIIFSVTVNQVNKLKFIIYFFSMIYIYEFHLKGF